MGFKSNQLKVFFSFIISNDPNIHGLKQWLTRILQFKCGFWEFNGSLKSSKSLLRTPLLYLKERRYTLYSA